MSQTHHLLDLLYLKDNVSNLACIRCTTDVILRLEKVLLLKLFSITDDLHTSLNQQGLTGNSLSHISRRFLHFYMISYTRLC